MVRLAAREQLEPDLVPRCRARAKLQTTALAGPSLDLAWTALLPGSSVLAGASILPPDAPGDDSGILEEKLSHAFARAVADLYELQTGNPRAMIEPDLQAWLAAREELHGPRRAWALFTGPEHTRAPASVC